MHAMLTPFILPPPALQRFRMGLVTPSRLLPLLHTHLLGAAASPLPLVLLPSCSAAACVAPGPFLLLLLGGASTLPVGRPFGKHGLLQVCLQCYPPSEVNPDCTACALLLKETLSELYLSVFIYRFHRTHLSPVNAKRHSPMIENTIL